MAQQETRRVPLSLRGHSGTALHVAAALGHADAVGILVASGADVKLAMGPLFDRMNGAEGPRGDTPLHAACRAGHPEVVKLLLRAGSALSPSLSRRNAADACGNARTPWLCHLAAAFWWGLDAARPGQHDGYA